MAATMAAVGGIQYFMYKDKEPVTAVKEDDADMVIPPQGDAKKPSGPPLISSSQDKLINLSSYRGLDISDYDVIKLKSDRSFIRAFYYIRNGKDPTPEQLQTFVDTNLVTPIRNLQQEDPVRVKFVILFVRLLVSFSFFTNSYQMIRRVF